MPGLLQECPLLDTTVTASQQAEVDSYQSFSLPIYLLDAFGSLVTKGPGSDWDIRLSHVAAYAPLPGQLASTTGGLAKRPGSAAESSAGQQLVGLVGASRGRLEAGFVLLDNMTLEVGPGSTVILQVAGGPRQASATQVGSRGRGV